MAKITVRELIEAGAHFGHKARRWNPKMKPYIYGARSGIHIIDLQQTVEFFRHASRFAAETVARGDKILFVGTKRQAQNIVAEHGARAKMPFVSNRWLGGTITNFRTIKSCLEKLRNMEKFAESPEFGDLSKKESARFKKNLEKLGKSIGGIKDMTRLPAAVFVIDPKKERNSVTEARKLNIPIIGIVDTNCDPSIIDFVIPANDDAMRSITLITSRVADSCIEGAKLFEERMAGKAEEPAAAAAASEEREKVEGAAYEIVFKEEGVEGEVKDVKDVKVGEDAASRERRARLRPPRRKPDGRGGGGRVGGEGGWRGK